MKEACRTPSAASQLASETRVVYYPMTPSLLHHGLQYKKRPTLVRPQRFCFHCVLNMTTRWYNLRQSRHPIQGNTPFEQELRYGYQYTLEKIQQTSSSPDGQTFKFDFKSSELPDVGVSLTPMAISNLVSPNRATLGVPCRFMDSQRGTQVWARL